VEVWPVRTNAGFLVRCLEHPRFVGGDVDTGFIAAEGVGLMPSASGETELAAAALYAQKHREPRSAPRSDDWTAPWDVITGLWGFRMNAPERSSWVFELEGQRIQRDAMSAQSFDSTWLVQDGASTHQARYDYRDGSGGAVVVGTSRYGHREWGDDHVLFDRGQAFRVTPPQVSGSTGAAASDGSLRAPMPGKIVSVPVKAGEAVVKGQPVVALEAMKMEHALVAPFDGVVETVSVAVGDQVVDGAVLAVVVKGD